MADEEKKIEEKEPDYTVKDFDLDKWELNEENSKRANESLKNHLKYLDPALPEEYEIKVDSYSYKDPEKHYWGVCKMTILKDGKELTHINRNYGFYAENIAYAKQGDNEYLITSGNYQTFCIVNLHTGETKIYYHGPIRLGGGWCPAEIEWQEDCNRLRIYGCVWGGDFGNLYIKDITDLGNLVLTSDNQDVVYDDGDDYEEEPDEDDE